MPVLVAIPGTVLSYPCGLGVVHGKCEVAEVARVAATGTACYRYEALAYPSKLIPATLMVVVQVQ